RDEMIALVSTENMSGVESFVASMREAFSDNIGVRSDLGLVTIVGEGIGNRTTVQELATEALHDAQVTIKFTFTSRASVSFVVYSTDVDKGMTVAHDRFLSALPS
ncbi:MAG: hypothetical protein KC561_21675, partial [Myxococcales bacterium]|nr:hypothetical protein [Myxococcales bacterium]